MATTINAGRVAMVPKGTWSSSTAYSRLDVVQYNGSSYVAIQDSTGQNPSTATTYWQLLAGGVDSSNYYTKTETNTKLAGKQNTLVSGTNIKTINGESLLGRGNITIQGGGGEQVQSDWNESDSTDPAYILNKPDLSVYATSAAMTTALASKADAPLVVNVSGAGISSNPYAVDKTFNEIVAAVQAHKEVVLLYGGKQYVLNTYQGYRVIFNQWAENDTRIMKQFSVMTDNSVVYQEFKMGDAPVIVYFTASSTPTLVGSAMTWVLTMNYPRASAEIAQAIAAGRLVVAIVEDFAVEGLGTFDFSCVLANAAATDRGFFISGKGFALISGEYSCLRITYTFYNGSFVWLLQTERDPNKALVDFTIESGNDSVNIDVDTFQAEFKTIEGQSIIGTGDIDLSGKQDKIATTQKIPVAGLVANKYMYDYGTTDSVTITLAAGETGVANIWMFTFTAQSSACSVTLPQGVSLGNEYAWDMVAGRKFEVSIMNGIAIVNYVD